MFKKYKDKLFCFSPPVMLATFIIEFGLALYVLWRYKLNRISRLVLVTLIALGTFQLAEYMVCGGLGLKNVDWARIGYGAITLLPALGIHLMTAISGKKMPVLVNFAYATCATFIAFYLVGEGAVVGKTCTDNYAVFNTQGVGSLLFGVYYYGWLLVGIILAFYLSKKYPKKRKALISMIVGYLLFIVPTAFFNIVEPSTVQGIPSIMCGFAVLFAVTLVTKVLPNSFIPMQNHVNDAIKIIQKTIND